MRIAPRHIRRLGGLWRRGGAPLLPTLQTGREANEDAGARRVIYRGGWLDPTRIVGLTAYFFAAACCGVAWIEGRGDAGRARFAAVLAALEAGLLLDMAFNVRWRLHDLLEGKAIVEGLYSRRAGPQIATMGLMAAAAVAGMWLAGHRLRGRPGATVAACGVIFSLTCWFAEVVSLHAIDSAFHRVVCGVMAVSLFWAASSLLTGLGILWETRGLRGNARQDAIAARRPPSSFKDF